MPMSYTKSSIKHQPQKTDTELSVTQLMGHLILKGAWQVTGVSLSVVQPAVVGFVLVLIHCLKHIDNLIPLDTQ